MQSMVVMSGLDARSGGLTLL